MKVFTTLSILIALANISCQADENLTPEDLCRLVKEGQHVKDVDSCNVYYKCVKGQAVRKQCPRGRVFDKENVICIDSTHCDPVAERDCRNKVNGFVADSSSCIGYYYCERGLVVGGRNCPDGQVFDATINGGSCVWESRDKKCARDSSICSYVKSGQYFGSPNNCKEWRRCSADGTLSKGSCTADFFFDLTDGTCAYQSDCRQTGALDQPIKKPPPPATTTCAANSTEFISDGATCGGYYWCPRGQTVGRWGKCADNKFFDAANSDCVARTAVVCPYDRCYGLGPGVKWVGITGDGCRGFNYCQDGEQMAGQQSELCGNNAYFNEVQQRCVNTRVNHPSCAVPPPPPTNNGNNNGANTGGGQQPQPPQPQQPQPQQPQPQQPQPQQPQPQQPQPQQPQPQQPQPQQPQPQQPQPQQPQPQQPQPQQPQPQQPQPQQPQPQQPQPQQP